MREQYKHLLNFTANLVTAIVNAALFALIWYSYYSKWQNEHGMVSKYWNRGNWAVVGMYILIIFFFVGDFRIFIFI